jgi:hypothetical protein
MMGLAVMLDDLRIALRAAPERRGRDRGDDAPEVGRSRRRAREARRHFRRAL